MWRYKCEGPLLFYFHLCNIFSQACDVSMSSLLCGMNSCVGILNQIKRIISCSFFKMFSGDYGAENEWLLSISGNYSTFTVICSLCLLRLHFCTLQGCLFLSSHRGITHYQQTWIPYHRDREKQKLIISIASPISWGQGPTLRSRIFV